MVRKFLTSLVLLTIILFPLVPVLAEETPTPEPTSSSSSSSSSSSGSKADLEAKKREYEAKLKQLSQQKNTLSSQIDYMDTQIYLTELKTQQTEEKIEATEKEIDSLSTRIDGLDSSLDNLSKTLLNRVVSGYKERRISVFEYLLDSENANDFFGKVKYQKTAQENNQKLLFQVQQTKSNFQEMKDIKEKKKEELAKLKDTLALQKEDLIDQQASKQRLLNVTRSDESTYQSLLAEANRQIASFKTFVASTGVGTIAAGSLGTGEGGWYLSQRDSRWAGVRMGSSPESILDVGCFITSISMVMRFYGYDYNPTMIANDSKYFLGNSAYLYIPSTFNGSWPGGKTYRNISYGQIADYLGRNVPVIAGVRGGGHYVVLKKTSGDEFIMNDPIYGPDIKVSEHYSLSGPYGVFE